MSNRLIRLLSLSLIVAAAIGFVTVHGPEPARAEVFRIMAHQPMDLMGHLRLFSQPGGKRLIIINGQKLQGTLTRTEQTPAALLDELARNESAHPDRFPATIDQAPASGDQSVSEMLGLLQRPFRIQNDNWGIYGRLALSARDGRENSLAGLAGRTPGAVDTEKSFLFFAMRPAGQEAAHVWSLRFGPEFNPFALFGKNGEDVPGKDLDDLTGADRYPGARRIFTLSEYSRHSEAHIVGYEDRGLIAEHADHYARALRDAGFRQVYLGSNADGGVLLQFDGGKSELAVSVSKDVDNSHVIALIQQRILQ